jgi:hypothetical protein
MQSTDLGSVAAQTVAIGKLHGFSPARVEGRFAHAESVLPSGSLRLSTQRLVSAGTGEMRAMSLSSAKVDVLTVFIIPEPRHALALYAMQLVSLGGRPVVAVLDAHTLCDCRETRRRTHTLLDTAKALFPVTSSQDIPEWYQACRSGHEIFSRPAPDDGLATHSRAHLWLVSRLLAQYADNDRRLDPEATEAHRERIAEYLRHHAANSAGRPLMNRAFGEDFSSSYIEDCLFRAGVGDSVSSQIPEGACQ